MTLRLADRLSAARHRRFVGRAPELALFGAALAAPELPFQVLHVVGPGGIGKTTLLGEFARHCQVTRTPAIYLDTRNMEPSPDAFLSALGGALGCGPSDSPFDLLATQAERHAILIDTWETLGPLDGWLREAFLPQLSENALIVLASRHPPSSAWRTDAGWQTLIRTVLLRNLSPEESRDYLARRAVPATQHQTILDFTHGHPLALSLVADVFAQRGDFRFQPEAAPDVVQTLLEQLVQKVPGPAHRAALEVCALVHLTTEALLAEVLGLADAHDLFEWLRGLSFIESGRLGLFPHDLARDALVADLRWRNPDWYADLHRRAGTYYASRVQQTHGQEQQRLLVDYIFLHRDNPAVRPFFERLWPGGEADGPSEGGSVLPDVLRDADRPGLLAMVAQHEGEPSAQLAAHWLARQPQGVLVFRDAGREPIGFVVALALNQACSEDLAVDPAVQAAWRYLQRYGPLRPGERASLFRFWMGRETYQAISPTQGLIFVHIVRHYLTTPGLAFTFLPCADPDLWAAVFAYADLARLPEADFEVGGRRYGVFGHDWRTVPPLAWLKLLAEREVVAEPKDAPAPRPAEPLAVLSQADFTAAVREVLQGFRRAEALGTSPLLRSRLVVERVSPSAGEADRIGALRDVVKEAVESLQAVPRQMKLYRALYHTYLHPARTQEEVAGLLGLPFSTYRRHLKAGFAKVVEVLWQWELHGRAREHWEPVGRANEQEMSTF